MGYGADEIYTRSAQRSLQLWQDLFTQVDRPLFFQTGVLWLAHEDDPYPDQSAETLRKLKIPFERMTTTEVSRRYPQIGLEGISRAVLEPESGVLIARRAVCAVVKEAIKSGVEYLQDAVEPPSGPGPLNEIICASGRRVSAGQYVFACGPWLPRLFPNQLASRIHPTRQEVFFFGASAGRAYAPPALPTWIDFKDEVYSLPDLEGRGVKIAIDRHGPPFDPDGESRIVSADGLEAVRRRLARRLPALKDAPVTETRVCQYENTSNGDFLVDLHPEFDNVWLVGGGSGHGFKHGPVVGEYVAARVAGSDKGIEPRFSLESKARTQQRTVF